MCEGHMAREAYRLCEILRCMTLDDWRKRRECQISGYKPVARRSTSDRKGKAGSGESERLTTGPYPQVCRE